MKRIRLGFGVGHIVIMQTLSGSSILIAILFLTGCGTTKKEPAEPSTVMREPEKDHEIHGEVGVMYGSSVGRH